MKSIVNPRIIILVTISLVLYCCEGGKKTSVEGRIKDEKELDWKNLSRILMERMDLQSGERVLFVAKPGRFDPLVAELARAVKSSQAEFLGCVSVTDDRPKKWSSDFVNPTYDMEKDKLREYLKDVDIGIMLPGATPNDLVYKLIQDNLDVGVGRTIHFHWSGAYDISGEEIEINREIDLFYQASLLNTDYQKLAEDQLRFEKAMRGNTVRVTTPAGTDISFEIGDRPVTKQDGNASAIRAGKSRNLIDREIELPAGAIRVAPLEESVNGRIAFPDAIWGDEMISGLVLEFEKGKVVEVKASQGLDDIKSFLAAGDESRRSFREFAIGMNPTIAIPESDPWIPYFGYGAGVVRLSLGDNTELGGNVSGNYLRWNFFTNATVYVGDGEWVVDGKLLK